MPRTAVILFNLGGPDKPGAVKPFLFNLFNDPAIIRLPWGVRTLAAKLISSRRAPVAAAIYEKIGGHSPILENTETQARVLEKVLGEGFKCFVAMRYWHPFAAETVAQVKTFAPDKIILLPLYPQFSTTTTASSLKAWRRAASQAGLNAPTQIVCCYPEEAGFITTLARAARAAYDAARARGAPRMLFSAHGLPEKIVRGGDPYQWQCERTAEALVKALGIADLDWTLCYQSRVGPLRWIGPATEDEIKRTGRDRAPVVIVPIAFVSEHSETLVELDIEYRHLAEQSGVPFYIRVPTASVAPEFIEGLAALVRGAARQAKKCISAPDAHPCSKEFSGCLMSSEMLG